MGLTYIQATVANPAGPRGGVRLKLLVDSGAVYSVVPAPVLRRLRIRKGKTKSFTLADGSEVKRSIGQALFRINGDEGASPVIFGEEGDSVLLGSVSLEALGLMLDPLKRELRPLPMMLASARSGPPSRGRVPVLGSPSTAASEHVRFQKKRHPRALAQFYISTSPAFSTAR